jgi:hypothetical protein
MRKCSKAWDHLPADRFPTVGHCDWKIRKGCATVGRMRSVGRSPSTTGAATRRGSASGPDSGTYLVRGRVGFLTVSEGGRSLTIMVGPLRGPEHLELIRRARYYHVPVSAIAASRTAVAYIAFYEGASRFHARTGVIREYAAVLRVARARRSELPGLSWPARGAPDAPYFRFDLGPIQQLARPITNPERLRVAFRFPNFDRLYEAETLGDLGTRAPKDRKTGGLGKRSVTRSTDV